MLNELLNKELTNAEEAAVDRIVNTIQNCGDLDLDKQGLIDAVLISVISLVASLDAKNAHVYFLKAAEAAGSIVGKEIEVHYQDRDNPQGVIH